MTIWETKNGEFLGTCFEPENELDKYAVAAIKNSVVVGQLAKGKTSRFSKTISFYLRASNDNSCKVEVTGKRVNFGNGHDLPILCILHFIGLVNFINKLKEILPP